MEKLYGEHVRANLVLNVEFYTEQKSINSEFLKCNHANIDKFSIR